MGFRKKVMRGPKLALRQGRKLRASGHALGQGKRDLD